MDDVNLELNATAAGRSAAGLVYAGLLWRVDGLAFPHENWSDFAVVVLSWWLPAAASLLRNPAQHADLRFMEGPYLLEVTPVHSRAWRITFVEAGVRRRVWREASVDPVAFASNLIDVAGRLQLLCRERDWWSADADNLSQAIGTLQDGITAQSREN